MSFAGLSFETATSRMGFWGPVLWIRDRIVERLELRWEARDGSIRISVVSSWGFASLMVYIGAFAGRIFRIVKPESMPTHI